MPKVEKADVIGHKSYYKKRKNRAERRNARRNPECVPGYGRYRGWAS
jgi:hypothetical protein